MKLLELITRRPGAIPSILNNDPNQAFTVEGRGREADCYHYCYHYYRDSRAFHRRTRASDKPGPFAREEESLSPDRRDRKLMTANHRRDLSIHRRLIDDSVTHLPGFPGSRAAAVPPSRYHFGIRRIDSTLVRRLLRCLDVSTAEAMR